MKLTAIAALSALALSAGPSATRPDEHSVATTPPVVVHTEPRAGAVGVDPGLKELRVTFSKKMQDKSWSWSTAWEGSPPEIDGAPSYAEDGMTCVLPVKMEANRTYGFWLNSQRFGNFRDTDGRSAMPYLFVFETGDGKASDDKPKKKSMKKKGTAK